MMPGFFQHMLISLRLNFRSIQAIVYGYVFPILFLLGFGSIYSKENPPLQNELNQLLTVTILSGACFGMPTSMVSERERGVWRRYRLLPAATGTIVASAMIVRMLIVFVAFILQIVLAHFIYGTPWPAHPLLLLAIFPIVTFAFLGLGLMIAMLADNVPAVQALGQAIFLPMIMIGGIGLKLDVLPEWARHVAAFLPGIYAVDAFEAALHEKAKSYAIPLPYCLIALTLIGLSGLLAGRLMFRWDVGQKVKGATRSYVMVALLAWIAIGLFAEQTGKIKPRRNFMALQNSSNNSINQETTSPATLPSTMPSTMPSDTVATGPSDLMAKQAPWMTITDADIGKITYEDLPPDGGTVVPFARDLDHLDDDGKKLMEDFTSRLDDWAPGKVPDLEQRVRNLISVMAIADVLQDQHEMDFPVVVYEHLRYAIPEDNLKKILAYISNNPERGKVFTKVPELGIEGEVFEEGVRERSEAYARKILARLVGLVK